MDVCLTCYSFFLKLYISTNIFRAKAAEEARLAAEEEAKRPEVLAAKYAAMDLEERAFTILCVSYVFFCILVKAAKDIS